MNYIAKPPKNFLELYDYIDETKSFWKVDDFKKEIIDFEHPNVHIPDAWEFFIGHPETSVPYRPDRGVSFGDCIPYTRLPELIKMYYGWRGAKVFIPEWFIDVFQHNPYVDGTHEFDYKWGSMGTFGTTIQRCSNAWGLTSPFYTPKLYASAHIKKRENSILFTLNSKTGGRVTQNETLEKIVKHLTKKYRVVQLALSDDYLVKSANQHVLNVSRDKLIDFVAEFPIYIGAQNSVYHIAKGLGLKMVGILPKKQMIGEKLAGLHSEKVVLPLLTVTNSSEVTPYDEKYWSRAKKFNPFFPKEYEDGDVSSDKAYNDTIAHLGWLYPDTPHLTLDEDGSPRCPTLSEKTIDMALEDKIYPFNDSRLWDYYEHTELWTSEHPQKMTFDSDEIKDNKFVFQHIPRTGGNLFRNVLWSIYGIDLSHKKIIDKVLYDENCFIKDNETIIYEDYGDHPQWNNYEVKPTVNTSDYKCVIGHFTIQKHLDLKSRGYKFVNWFRNPIDRVISQYFYDKMSAENVSLEEINDPVRKKLIEENMSLYEYCEMSYNRNIYSDYVGDKIYELDFIGITENYKDSLKKFEKMFNIKIPIGPRNVSFFDDSSADDEYIIKIKNQRKHLYSTDDIDRNIIEELNKEDMKIYNQAVRINSEYKL